MAKRKTEGYLRPIAVEAGWTSALFTAKGELVTEYGFWATEKDAQYGCRIMADQLEVQTRS